MNENTVYKNDDHPFEGLVAAFKDLEENKPEVFGDVEIDLTYSSQIELGYRFELVCIKPSTDSTNLSVELIQGPNYSTAFTIDIDSENPIGNWPTSVFPSLYAVVACVLIKLNQSQKLAYYRAATTKSLIDSGISAIDGMTDEELMQVLS